MNLIKALSLRYLIHKLFKPFVGHDPVTLIASRVAPAVLNAPTHRVTIFVQMNSREHHSVGHQTLAIQDSLLLGQAKLDVESKLIVVKISIHGSDARVGELTNITAEPNWSVALEDIDSKLLEVLGSSVNVSHRRSANHIAKSIDCVQARIFVTRVIDEGHGLSKLEEKKALSNASIPTKLWFLKTLYLVINDFLIELLGRQILDTDELAILVLDLPVKLLGRLAESDHQDSMDLGNHLIFLGSQG